MAQADNADRQDVTTTVAAISGTRWLLELIGEARSPRAVPLPAVQLHGPDKALRSWATAGLRLADTRESRKVLYQAHANGLIS